jgi:hypothetical protein
MAQVVALILLAQTSGAGASSLTSLEVGRFLSMETCRYAAAHAVTVQALPDAKIGYICLPLTESAGR